MKSITDLNYHQIYKVFDMLDVDGSGEIDFDEFYLLMCIIIAVKVITSSIAAQVEINVYSSQL